MSPACHQDTNKTVWVRLPGLWLGEAGPSEGYFLGLSDGGGGDTDEITSDRYILDAVHNTF